MNADGRGVIDFLLASDVAMAKEAQRKFPEATPQAAPPDKGRRQGQWNSENWRDEEWFWDAWNHKWVKQSTRKQWQTGDSDWKRRK